MLYKTCRLVKENEKINFNSEMTIKAKTHDDASNFIHATF